MLQDIAEKSKRESQLKRLIVLILRILSIIALVTAFAQPYIPHHDLQNGSGNLVTIYVDNSFSMEVSTPQATLFDDAVNNARKIINHFQFADEFVLYNNDFSARQMRRLNKEEALQVLDNWTISPNSKNWDDLLIFEKNMSTGSQKKNVFHYYISDFQKNNFNLHQYHPYDASPSFWIPMPAKEISNVSIDSCWFLAPVFRVGQQVTLSVRLRNCSESDVVKLPLKLYVNGEQKAMAAVDVTAQGMADYQLNYTLNTTGLQCAMLEIEDIPITFDNQLYFTYQVAEATNVTVICAEKNNRYLNALFAKDSVFACTEMLSGKIDYSKFSNSALIVLSELPNLSSGLADELEKYLQNGGTVLVLPSESMDNVSWNAFLSQVGSAQYGAMIEEPIQIGSINMESVYFKGSLQNSQERLDYPMATRRFNFSDSHADEVVMSFEDGQPALLVNHVGKGKVILSAIAMNDQFGNIHKHALFFIPLHNMGIRSVMQQKLYNVIGSDHGQSIAKNLEGSEDVYSLKLRNGNTEYIPEQRNLGNETMLYFDDQFNEAGIYDVLLQGVPQTAVAFNYNRQESQLTYYTESEINDFIDMQTDSNNIELIDAASKDITQNVAEALHGNVLWRWFVLFALCCLAAEIAILRLWKSR